MATRLDGRIRIPFMVPLLNPIAFRLLRLGVPMGPNVLLTVRGRKSGLMRTTPVALVELGGRRWVIAPFGEVNWVRNLRSAGEGILTLGRRQEPVRAVELTRNQAAAFFAEILGPYVRHLPLARWLVGSVLNARDIIDDPDGAALRHPAFELHRAA